MRLFATIVSVGLAAPALAGVDEALNDHILPGFDNFATSAAALSDKAATNCLPEAVRPAYHDAFDAWMPVADLRLGPSETGALPVAFWPDPRGFTQRKLSQFIAGQDPIARDPAGYADVSIAARGFFALERLIYDPSFADYETGSYTCELVTTIAADLANQAAALDAGWRGEFTKTLRSAGEDGNATFLSGGEARRALYTQVVSALEFTAQKRLGAPMGTFERPRPARAEARRSGRSLRNVVMAAEAAHGLAAALADWPTPESDSALATVREAASRIEEPAFQDVDDPQGRLRAEILQQAITGLREAIAVEIGARYGIAPGFNSQDGD
ncbi:MAG: signal peptidase [Alphaproteobacteria bacterium]|jgi:predicted lipoprotein|nr:signal peptidase [Alphaproteobacteria bacterium]